MPTDTITVIGDSGAGATVLCVGLAIAHHNTGKPVVLRSHFLDDTAATLGLPESSGDEPQRQLLPGFVVTDLTSGVVHKDGQLTVIDAGHLLRPDRDWSRTTGFTVLCLRGPSYRAIRRALKVSRVDLIAVLREPGRVLGATDINAVLDTTVTEIEYDPAVARADDAGLLGTRLPRSLRTAALAVHHAAGLHPVSA